MSKDEWVKAGYTEPSSCKETLPPTLGERVVEINEQISEMEISMDALMGDVAIDPEKSDEPAGAVGRLELSLHTMSCRLIALRKRIQSLANRI